MNNNLMESNALAGITLRKKAEVKSSSSPRKKKTKLNVNASDVDNGIESFPDGNTIVVIHHQLGNLDEHTFPPCWGDGDPWDGFHELYDSVDSYDSDEYHDDNFLFDLRGDHIDEMRDYDEREDPDWDDERVGDFGGE